MAPTLNITRLRLLFFCASFAACASASSITVNSDCFAIGQNIDITFQDDSPMVDDFVAFYSPATALDSLPNPSGIEWLWTCGSRKCTTSNGIPSATISYKAVLPEGTWIVALVDNAATPPYTAKAVSHSFVVSATCGGGGNIPTPTNAPVNIPAPTNPPVDRTVPSGSIVTDKSSYSVGESIQVAFNTANPAAQDWIGIYPASTDSNFLFEATLWLWTCGDQVCSTSPSSNNLVFGSSSGWTASSWPLSGATTWVAYSLRANTKNSNGGFIPVAVSSPFSIVQGTSGGGNANGFGSGTQATIAAARKDIVKLIMGPGGNQKLAAKFLRMGFHDSIGGFDGCIDLTNPENGGLQVPINAMRSIVQAYEGRDGVTRADLWALAATVGADVLQTDVRVFMNMDTVGRINCEDANSVCLNEAGVQQECSATRGPHRVIPGMVTNSRDLFDFFNKEFGFSVKQGVALMGAHTIGELRAEDVGVQGHGWLRNNNIFNNEYYKELIGGFSINDSLDTNINDAPNWQQTVEMNSLKGNGFPDKHIFSGRPGGIKIVMLQADIALVRDLNPGNMDKDGVVSCNFRRQGRCPHNDFAIHFAIQYRFDNQLWMNDFHDVLQLMINHGYTVSNNCQGKVCLLTPN